MRRLVEHAERDPRPSHVVRRVEHPELEAREKQSRDRRVDLRFGDEPLLHRLDEIRVHAPAVEIRARLHAERGGLWCGRQRPCGAGTMSSIAPQSETM